MHLILRPVKSELFLRALKIKPRFSLLFLSKEQIHIVISLTISEYLRQFLQYELEKSVKVKEYISEKYRRQPKLSYRPLLATDIIPEPESEIRKLYNKFINLRSFSCILCGVFSIHYEKILGFIRQKIKNVF